MYTIPTRVRPSHYHHPSPDHYQRTATQVHHPSDMSTLPTNRKSHCCGCTHATSNVKSKPEVDEALLERRDLHLGNYLAEYLTPRVHVLAKVKSMIEDGSDVNDVNGTISLAFFECPATNRAGK